MPVDDLGGPSWREVFNSDALIYGGWNVGHLGRELRAAGGELDVVLPACGLVVLESA